jgi:protein gp37
MRMSRAGDRGSRCQAGHPSGRLPPGWPPSGWLPSDRLVGDLFGRSEDRLTDDPGVPRRVASRPPAESWFDVNWNPIIGCSPVSPGCELCVAKHAAAQLARMGGRPGARYAGLTRAGAAGLRWTGEVRIRDELLIWPLRRPGPRRILLGSMSDLFHEAIATAVLDRLHAVVAIADWHRFLVLTKRAERMRSYYSDPQTPARIACEMAALPAAVTQSAGRGRNGASGRRPSTPPGWAAGLERILHAAPAPGESAPPPIGIEPWPLPNLWLGVSVEDQHDIGRIGELAQTPAALRWACFEPLLGPVRPDAVPTVDGDFDALRGVHYRLDGRGRPALTRRPPWPALDWVVAGGEIGAGARPMQPDWLRRLRDLCGAVQVPFFFKQWGEWAPAEDERFGRRMVRRGRRAAGRLLDGETWSRMPRR